jgi:hypothetical protein
MHMSSWRSRDRLARDAFVASGLAAEELEQTQIEHKFACFPRCRSRAEILYYRDSSFK